jgi:hypothetical protein
VRLLPHGRGIPLHESESRVNHVWSRAILRHCAFGGDPTDERRNRHIACRSCCFSGRKPKTCACSRIGVTGFEPATSWSQTRRSTKLSYTPGTCSPIARKEAKRTRTVFGAACRPQQALSQAKLHPGFAQSVRRPAGRVVCCIRKFDPGDDLKSGVAFSLSFEMLRSRS